LGVPGRAGGERPKDKGVSRHTGDLEPRRSLAGPGMIVVYLVLDRRSPRCNWELMFRQVVFSSSQFADADMCSAFNMSNRLRMQIAHTVSQNEAKLA
jgi:hypothetical protein